MFKFRVKAVKSFSYRFYVSVCHLGNSFQSNLSLCSCRCTLLTLGQIQRHFDQTFPIPYRLQHPHLAQSIRVSILIKFCEYSESAAPVLDRKIMLINYIRVKIFVLFVCLSALCIDCSLRSRQALLNDNNFVKSELHFGRCDCL